MVTVDAIVRAPSAPLTVATDGTDICEDGAKGTRASWKAPPVEVFALNSPLTEQNTTLPHFIYLPSMISKDPVPD